MKKKILLSTIIFSSMMSYAQPGELDSTFGTNGILSSSSGSATSIAIQSNNKILLAGATGISRYNTNGVIDNTFGNNGTQSTDFPVASIAVQGNDKFVVAGSITGDFVVARFNSDGSPDNSFSGDGKQITDLANNNDHALSV